MGVPYKLTDEIVQFILAQKQENAALSCRDLTERICTHFKLDISKSTVHDVLKEHDLTQSRPRKDKFQIPLEKKKQLLANIPQQFLNQNNLVVEALATQSIAQPLLESRGVVKPEPKPSEVQTVAERVPAAPRAVPVVMPEPVTKSAFKIEEFNGGLDQIFLEAAFSDIFPKGWRQAGSLGDLYNLQSVEFESEWAYRMQRAHWFMLENAQGKQIYIDCRWQGLSAERGELLPASAPIERALLDMAKRLISNTQIIVIKEFINKSDSVSLQTFVEMMSLDPAGILGRVAVLAADQSELFSLDAPAALKRLFIIGVESKTSAIKADTEQNDRVKSYNNPLLLNPCLYNTTMFMLGKVRLKLIRLEGMDRSILTNNLQMADEDVVQLYLEQWGGVGHFQENIFPEANKEVSFGQNVQQYAETLFGKALSIQNLSKLGTLKGKKYISPSQTIITIDAAAGWGEIIDLKYAVNQFNMLQVHTPSLQKINVILI